MTRKEKMLRFKYRLTHSYAFLLKFTTKDRKIVFVLQLAAEWMGSEMIVMRSGWCSQVT